MSLSSTQYLEYRELFKRAIAVYEKNQMELQGHIWHYIRNPDFSMLPELKAAVEAKQDIPARALRLLGNILEKYRCQIPELKQREWIKVEAIEDEIRLLDKCEKDIPNLIPKQ